MLRPSLGFYALFYLTFAGMSGVAAHAQVLLEKAGNRLSLAGSELRIERSGELIIDIQAIEFNFTKPTTLAIASRTVDSVVLHATYPGTAKHEETKDVLAVDIEVTLVAGGFHFHSAPAWARNTTVLLRDLDDHYFGIVEQLYPNNLRTPDLRGAAVDIDAQSDQALYHENFASVWSAFYMTSRGYASFFDTFARGRYRLGLNGQTELYHRTGTLDWYLFFGRDGDELLASYYKVIGAPKSPPLWAMGPIGWRDENKGGAEELSEDVRHMTELHIPFTAWWVDRPYSDGTHEWSKMNFNQKFANPREWIARLKNEYDLTCLTWIGPMTFGDPDFPGLLPGDMGYIDLSNPASLQEFERRLSAQYSVGIRGHKMDRGEEYFPEMDQWKDGTTDNESRNKYLFLYAKVIDGFLQKAWGGDHFNFARGAFHRTQPFLNAVWGGDPRSSWEGLASNLANSIRCGFMGFPIWGTDCGGNLGGRIEEELYARWVEWGAWNGLFEIKLDDINGSGPDRPPWVYGEKLQAAFRGACEQRMRLLPYVYSLAQTSGTSGVLMKPLAYVWPKDPATYGVWDEYLFGSAFLVAPLTAPGGKRSVYLPEGTWYDFYDPAHLYEGKQTIEVTSPFERIPIFLRANSIYITGEILIGNKVKWESPKRAPLVLHVYPGEPGQNTAFDFVDRMTKGTAKTITVERTNEGLLVIAPDLGAPTDIEVRSENPPEAKVGDQEAAVSYDAKTKLARVSLPAGKPIRVRWLFRNK